MYFVSYKKSWKEYIDEREANILLQNYSYQTLMYL